MSFCFLRVSITHKVDIRKVIDVLVDDERREIHVYWIIGF